jgi:adenine-specific DNA methylase
MSTPEERSLFSTVGTILISNRHMLGANDADQLVALHSICLNLLTVSTLTIVDFCAMKQGKDFDETLRRLREETKLEYDGVIDKMLEDSIGQAKTVTQEILRRFSDE